MEKEITRLNEIIDLIVRNLGGNNNVIIFSNMLSLIVTLLLVIVTALYVIFIYRSNIFSEKYAKFKVTDDLGKESEHEIAKAINFVENYYTIEMLMDYEQTDMTEEERQEFIKKNWDEFSIQINIIYNYFDRVYLNYKYNKIDRKIFFEQLAQFIINYKNSHHDLIIEKYQYLVGNRKNFLQLCKICKNYQKRINRFNKNKSSTLK